MWLAVTLLEADVKAADCSRLGDLLLIEHDVRVHQILGPLIRQLNSGSKEPTILQPTHSHNPGLEDRGLSFYPASGILEYFNSKSETSEYVDYEETTEAFLCKLFEWRLPTGVCFSSALTPAPTLPSNHWPRGGMLQVDGFLAVPAVQEDQQVITDTLRKLEANLQSLPPSGKWQFVESLSESPTSKCPFYRVYDLRGLGIHVSNEGPSPWQEIILWVCQGHVYSCASRSSHVIVFGDQQGHQAVEEVFKVLSTNAKLRAGFAAFAIRGRRALDAGASFPSADELLTESLSSESLVIRRVAAFLVSHNYTRVLSDSVMLRVLRTAWDGQDEVSLQLLCSVVRWRACGGEVVDLLREVVMETESPGVFSAAISALASQGRAGLTSLLDLDDLVDRNVLKDSNREKRSWLQSGISEAVRAVLWELAADPTTLTSEVELSLRRVENVQGSVSGYIDSAIEESGAGASDWKILEAVLIERSIISP
ncbi:MAG: hypothetical protein R3C99_13655 [Pirellulaceae bacterium]